MMRLIYVNIYGTALEQVWPQLQIVAEANNAIMLYTKLSRISAGYRFLDIKCRVRVV